MRRIRRTLKLPASPISISTPSGSRSGSTSGPCGSTSDHSGSTPSDRSIRRLRIRRINLFQSDFVARDITGINVIKLFAVVIYELLKYARAFVPGKAFQPSLMFTGEARSLPDRSTFQELHSRVGSWPYPQKLD